MWSSLSLMRTGRGASSFLGSCWHSSSMTMISLSLSARNHCPARAQAVPVGHCKCPASGCSSSRGKVLLILLASAHQADRASVQTTQHGMDSVHAILSLRTDSVCNTEECCQCATTEWHGWHELCGGNYTAGHGAQVHFRDWLQALSTGANCLIGIDWKNQGLQQSADHLI